MTSFTLTRMGGSAIITCQCGEASTPSRNDRVLDVWRREHDEQHREQHRNPAPARHRGDDSANPSPAYPQPVNGRQRAI